MRLAALVLLAGCGRFGFDARTAAADGATDTTRDARAGVCGGLFCDGFEGSAFDPRWMVDTFKGAAVVDTTRAHGGTQSLHVSTMAIASSTTNPRGLLVTFAGLPVASGTIYLRAWIFKQGPRPIGFFDQTINFADAAGEGISTGAKDNMIANNDYTAPTTYQQSANTTQTTDTWTCWIFQMPSGTTGLNRVFLDGTEVTDATIDVSSPQPAPDHLYLGTEWVGSPTSMNASDAWIDDVELATTMPSCN